MSILITGANRGIGRGLFEHFSARGDSVFGTCRGEPPADDGRWLPLDLLDPGSFLNLASQLDGVTLDLLVCNAGVYLDKGMKLAEDFPPEVWAESFAANVTGVFLSVQALLPQLQSARAPRIAIISSLMGSSERAPGGSYAYRASKAAAINLGRNLATDLKDLEIAVGVYHPGWVRTDMGGKGADISLEESVAGLSERIGALSLKTTGCFEGYDGTPLTF